MGWTYFFAENYKNGKIDRKAEADLLFTGEDESSRYSHKVLKSSMVGSTYYGAVERTDKKENIKRVIGTVILTHVDGYDFGYKMMSEFEGPYRFDCPKSILDLLSETEDEHALEWRKKCIENYVRKKAERNNPHSLKNLPVGTVIEFKSKFDYQNGIKSGDTMRLKKKKYLSHRPIWSDGYYRYSSKDIPDNFKIIEVPQ